MSTSDMTEYLRVKLAERGNIADAKFMEDGFDRWAESERPARVGQVEKVPAESKMESYGGAMSLSKAKKLQAMMMGGANVNIAGFTVDVPDIVINAVKEAKKLHEFLKTVNTRLPDLIEDITDNVIYKPQDYSPEIIADSKQFLGFLQSLRGYVTVIEKVLSFAQYIPTGSGRRGGKRGHTRVHFGGAATTLETITKWIKYVKDVGTQIYNYVRWFAQKARTLEVILKLDAAQPEGKQVLDALKPIFDFMGVVGLGRHRGRRGGRARSSSRSSSPECECHGGRKSPLPVLDINAAMMGGMSLADQKMAMEMQNINRRDARMHGVTMEQYNQKMASATPKVGLGRRHGGMSMAQMPAYSGPQYEFNYMNPSMGTAPKRPAMGMGKMRVVGGASCGGRAPSARAQIVKKVMQEHGLSLPQASSYVKQHGLY